MFCANCSHYVKTKVSDLGLCAQSQDSLHRPLLVDADSRACAKFHSTHPLEVATISIQPQDAI
jgi:hypothetical protein